MISTKTTTFLKTDLNKLYWEDRYQNQQTGWDIGSVSTPLKEYIDQIDDKNIQILVPGAGYGHEVRYLAQQGFKNVSVIDLSVSALTQLKKALPDTTAYQLIEGDFFEHHASYDLILEQTFFCALEPDQRPDYAAHAASLLKASGKIAGVLFNFPLTEKGPPFGGSSEEYKKLFSEYFNIKTLEACYNSIKPRLGNELFFIFEKSNQES